MERRDEDDRMMLCQDAPEYAADMGLIPLSSAELVHSMWGNILLADDGYIYVSAGNHETFNAKAGLFRFDPVCETVEPVCRLSECIGHRAGTSAVGDSKIHTRLLDDRQGGIYFATMQGGIAHISKLPHYTHPCQYAGGHLWRYDRYSDRLDDLGILVRGEGLQTAVIDPERNRLYFITWPKKMFVRYDIPTGDTRVLGVLAWSPTSPEGEKQNFGRDLMLGDEGKVYAINNFGSLVRYLPDTDELEDTDIYVSESDSLRAHVRDGDTMYLATSRGFLFQMDTGTESVTKLGQVTPAGAVYTPNLLLTPDKRKLAYLAGSHGMYIGGSLLLLTFDLATRTHTVLGMLNPRFWPSFCYGVTADPAGRWVFALHGGEPANSYLAIYDPLKPEDACWLVKPDTPRPHNRSFFIGPGTEGWTRGWIVAPYTKLTTNASGPIPHGQSAITSLTAKPDSDVVYGATSANAGKSAYLFRCTSAMPVVEVIADLGECLESAQSVRSGLVCASDGAVYGGTIDLLEDPFGEPKNSPCWTPRVPSGYEGGCLFRYRPGTDTVENLGIPVAGEGIYAMCASPQGDSVYALTYPSACLVAFNVCTGETRQLAFVYPADTQGLLPDEFELAYLRALDALEFETRKAHLLEKRGCAMSTNDFPDDALMRKCYPSRAIICDKHGNVYGSAAEGFLFRYTPGKNTLEILDARIPIAVGTEYGLIAEPSVTCFVRTDDGMIYGGTCQDGVLFRFDPRTQQVTALGKPDVQSHIRQLAVWRNDIYGIVGENLGKTHLFRYGLQSGSLDDLGVLQGGGREGFAVNVCDALAAGSDKRLWIGQSERISALMRLECIEYQPWQSP